MAGRVHVTTPLAHRSARGGRRGHLAVGVGLEGTSWVDRYPFQVKSCPRSPAWPWRRWRRSCSSTRRWRTGTPAGGVRPRRAPWSRRSTTHGISPGGWPSSTGSATRRTSWSPWARSASTGSSPSCGRRGTAFRGSGRRPGSSGIRAAGTPATTAAARPTAVLRLAHDQPPQPRRGAVGPHPAGAGGLDPFPATRPDRVRAGGHAHHPLPGPTVPRAAHRHRVGRDHGGAHHHRLGDRPRHLRRGRAPAPLGTAFTFAFRGRRTIITGPDGRRDVETVFPTVEANLPVPYGKAGVDTGQG